MSFYKYFSEQDRVVGTNNLLEEVTYDKGSAWVTQSAVVTYNFTKYATGSLWALSENVFDLTFGANEGVAPATNNEKIQYNIYNQFSKALFGYDENGMIKKMPLDVEGADIDYMPYCYVVNIPRMLMKDRIKENTFKLKVQVDSDSDYLILSDDSEEVLAGTEGNHYGVLTVSTSSTRALDSGSANWAGYIFYEAGVALVSPFIYYGYNSGTTDLFQSASANNICGVLATTSSISNDVMDMLTTDTSISEHNDFFNSNILNIQFKSITELNSSIYFCRAFNNEFNYSSNPTYLSSSEIVVKGGDPEMPPRTYITTVGLYDDTNQLLAVAKLSEPVLKTPENELIARVRLDF